MPGPPLSAPATGKSSWLALGLLLLLTWGNMAYAQRSAVQNPKKSSRYCRNVPSPSTNFTANKDVQAALAKHRCITDRPVVVCEGPSAAALECPSLLFKYAAGSTVYCFGYRAVADQYSESVRPCRPSVNSCDAPEYCSYGSSANPEDCPPDQPPLVQIGSGQLPGFGSDTPTFCRPIADDYNAQVPTTTKPVVVSCVESQLQYNYITYQYTPSKGGSTSFVLKPAPIPRWWFSDFLDTYMFIYEGTFNPQAPTTNLIAANDDCTSIVSNKQVPFQLSEALGVPYDPESFEAHVEGSCSTLRVAPNKNYTIVVASFYDNKYEYGPGKSGGFTLLVSSPDGTCPPV